MEELCLGVHHANIWRSAPKNLGQTISNMIVNILIRRVQLINEFMLSLVRDVDFFSDVDLSKVLKKPLALINRACSKFRVVFSLGVKLISTINKEVNNGFTFSNHIILH